jgi:hypothetical protein
MIEYKVKVYPKGTRRWYLDNKPHREDGPAVEYYGGTKEWYINGQRHREDGPAMEIFNGTNEWYLNDIRYTEEQFNKKINPKDCSGSTVVVDGVEYILNKK